MFGRQTTMRKEQRASLREKIRKLDPMDRTSCWAGSLADGAAQDVQWDGSTRSGGDSSDNDGKQRSSGNLPLYIRREKLIRSNLFIDVELTKKKTVAQSGLPFL